jgi:hypothetical protein
VHTWLLPQILSPHQFLLKSRGCPKSSEIYTILILKFWRFLTRSPHYKLNQKVLEFVESMEKSREHWRLCIMLGMECYLGSERSCGRGEYLNSSIKLHGMLIRSVGETTRARNVQLQNGVVFKTSWKKQKATSWFSLIVVHQESLTPVPTIRQMSSSLPVL